MPTSDGTADQIIATDGNGNLAWTAQVAPGGSSGTIQFNSNSAFAGDSELFWDNANKRLGIGTATPSTELEVSGTAKATAFMLPGGIYLNADSVTTNYWMETDGDIYREAGSIGLGTNSPAERLDVDGRIPLQATTSPVAPAERLYNVAGDLFWNGLKLIGSDTDNSVTLTGTLNAPAFYDSAHSVYLTVDTINGNYWAESGGNIYRPTRKRTACCARRRD